MTEPLRVLQVATIMNRGGLETMLMNYYRHIDRSKLQFDFMVHRSERGAYDDEIESLGGKIYRMPPIHPKYLFSYFRQLDAFFKEHAEYKIVHSHLDVLSTFVLRAARNNNVPVRISHSHSTSFPDTGLKKLFILCSKVGLNRECTHFFACSEAAGKFQFGDIVVNNGKLVVMKNAINTEIFKFNDEIRKCVRESLGLDDEFVVGHVGSFCAQKNHYFIIDVFYEVHIMDKNARLLLIGDGPLMGAIKEKVKALGLEGSVKFMGVLSNVNEYLMAMDVFLFPSLFEGLGIVAVEAQATGLPVVASSEVPKAAALTDSVIFVDLKRDVNAWASEVVKFKNTARDEKSNAAIVESYDIKDNSLWLQNFYGSAIQ